MKKLLSRSFRPSIEALEHRVTPSATLGYNYSVSVKAGVLEIHGGYAGDKVSVSQIPGTNKLRVVFGSNTHTFTNASKIKSIIFNGYGGNDVFQNNTAISCTARGGVGDDVLYGGFGVNTMYGDEGNDQLFGAGKVNFLFGGADDDYLLGDAGVDYIYGEQGDDTAIGGAGDDFLFGGTGKDALYGQLSNDTLDGGDDGSADYLNGGAGRDKFQVEGYGRPGSQLALLYFNLDDPADFNSKDDSFFGEDQPAATLDVGQPPPPPVATF